MMVRMWTGPTQTNVQAIIITPALNRHKLQAKRERERSKLEHTILSIPLGPRLVRIASHTAIQNKEVNIIHKRETC